MKVDFETLATILVFIINSVGLAALWRELEKDEIKEIKDDLGNAIKSNISNYGYVIRKRKKLSGLLISIWMILLHIINLIILIGLLLVLILGPENVFTDPIDGSLAEPLTQVERVLYWIWFGSFLLAYIIRGLVPTLDLIKLYIKSGQWLKKNEPKRKAT